MQVIALRSFGEFEKGGAYSVPDRDAERWIKQDMVAPLGESCFTEKWHGYKVVIIASGPSLTKADIAKIKKWRDAGEARRVIVVNASYQAAPWADVLLALDRDFWLNYKPDFAGAKITQHAGTAIEHGCYLFLRGTQRLRQQCNSGAAAIDFAARMGAKQIILTGFDGQLGPKGKAHWHKDHPSGMQNAVNIENWPAQAEVLASELPGSVTVLNATKRTAIRAWPQIKLEDAL